LQSRWAISAILPNYNGVDLLKANLPSVLVALERWGGGFEVIVVDDGSNDGSLELLRRDFPEVRVLVNDQNLGFSRTCNRGFAEAQHSILLAINTDVWMEPDSVASLLPHFDDPQVFAVTPNVLVEREGTNQGVTSGIYRKGFLKGRAWPCGQPVGVREIFFAVGACVAYRAEMVRALGGYAEIYSPYLFEDVDLSYRAWRRGWASLHEPGATVHHLSNGTLCKVKKRFHRVIYFRNRFIFHWSNLTDPRWLAANLLHTAFRLLGSWMWLDTSYYLSFWGALCQWRRILALRKEGQRHRELGDREILRRTS